MSTTSGGTNIYVDDNRFLVIDGIKVARITSESKLEFKDKDGRRSRRRGSAFVDVGLDEIHTALRYDFLDPRR